MSDLDTFTTPEELRDDAKLADLITAVNELRDAIIVVKEAVEDAPPADEDQQTDSTEKLDNLYEQVEAIRGRVYATDDVAPELLDPAHVRVSNNDRVPTELRDQDVNGDDASEGGKLPDYEGSSANIEYSWHVVEYGDVNYDDDYGEQLQLYITNESLKSAVGLPPSSSSDDVLIYDDPTGTWVSKPQSDLQGSEIIANLIPIVSSLVEEQAENSGKVRVRAGDGLDYLEDQIVGGSAGDPNITVDYSNGQLQVNHQAGQVTANTLTIATLVSFALDGDGHIIAWETT